ncbi:MAG: ABC transporter ATP-binding protein, partial [Treponema sp.]|nr:ABC transporter ATP-binding protein [Treponema sp.]
LGAFTGTIIFVSHDRGFMEALATKTLGLQPGSNHRLYYGGYAYYLERVAQSAQDIAGAEEPAAGLAAPPLSSPSAEAQPAAAESAKAAQPLPKTVLLKADRSANTLSAAEHREQEKQRQTAMRRLQRQEAEILKEIEALESEKTRLEGELARPEVYSSGEKAKAVQRQLQENAAALEAKGQQWEAAAEELGELAYG